jgi:hypothetical protein
MYEILDKQTGRVVATVKTLKDASRAVDRRDNAYGAYRYYHRRKASATAQAGDKAR